jgi:hypothetical protein
MVTIVYCSAYYLFNTIGYLASIIEYQSTTIHHFPHRSGYRIYIYGLYAGQYKSKQSSIISVTEGTKTLKVHKRENFLGSNIEICTFS